MLCTYGLDVSFDPTIYRVPYYAVRIPMRIIERSLLIYIRLHGKGAFYSCINDNRSVFQSPGLEQ